MALYRVIADGFYDGVTYSPTGKRTTLYRANKFKKTPSWLESVKEPTKAELKAAEGARAAEAKAAEEKAAQDAKDVESASLTPDQTVEQL